MASKPSDVVVDEKKDNDADEVNHRTILVLVPGKEACFRVERRYVPQQIVGTGAYAVVLSARDLKHNKLVCVKRIDGCWERRALGRSTLRELLLLRHFKHHPNILHLERVMRPRTTRPNNVYAVLELMDMNLDQVIRSPNRLLDDHVQFFVYQLLCGLKYIHSANVTHCDLKPQNLLVNLDCDLKIADFGLARFGSLEHATALFTLWYRPPEILRKTKNYTNRTDIWAVGCILGELLTRRPLLPGRDDVHQLQIIHNMLNIKDTKIWPRLGNVTSYSDQDKAKAALKAAKANGGSASSLNGSAASSSSSSSRHPPSPVLLSHLKRYCPAANPLAIDLLVKLLSYNPDDRPSAAKALEHPYFASLHDERDEPVCRVPLDPKLFRFENPKSTKSQIREWLYKEIVSNYPEQQFTVTPDMDEKGPKVIEKRPRRRKQKKVKKRKSL